jgi:hypothetical protein
VPLSEFPPLAFCPLAIGAELNAIELITTLANINVTRIIFISCDTPVFFKDGIKFLA